jgi:hypothetical protein
LEVQHHQLFLNNDSPNVYSESAVNGKLKFMLIDKIIYPKQLLAQEAIIKSQTLVIL